jgi:DNA-binding MarR family transcriptional regulator
VGPTQTVADSLERIVYGGVAITTVALEHATAGLGLTFTQWRAITLIGETEDGCRIGEVTRRMMGTLPATSRLLRRLERRALVTLDPDERDKRAKRARLTPDGLRLRAAVLAYGHEQLASVAAGVRPPALAEGFLGELATRVEAHGREAPLAHATSRKRPRA